LSAARASRFGIPLSFGGPYLGFFTTRKEPRAANAGRLVGETVDVDNQRGYVLTLSTASSTFAVKGHVEYLLQSRLDGAGGGGVHCPRWASAACATWPS